MSRTVMVDPLVNDVSLLGALKIEPMLELTRTITCLGAVAEFGVYRGGVLRELASVFPDRDVLGYDTFEGLPQCDWEEGELHSVGDFRDANYDEVRARFADLPNVRVIKGYLPECAIDVPYAFVHLDLDFYRATINSLRWLALRMAHGGAIVLDDYDWPYCPGVARAVAEFGQECTRISEFQGVLRF